MSKGNPLSFKITPKMLKRAKGQAKILALLSRIPRGAQTKREIAEDVKRQNADQFDPIIVDPVLTTTDNSDVL